jgi:hypothetical protein
VIILLLVEEFLDGAAVIAVVVSAFYWWRSSYLSHQAVHESETIRATLNVRAATSAAIAATMQALAVLCRLGEILKGTVS